MSDAEYTEGYLDGWHAAREVSQLKGSVPPHPPGYNPKPAAVEEEETETPGASPSPTPDELVGGESETDTNDDAE